MNIIFVITSQMLNISLFGIIFEKSSIFRKNCFGGAFDDFLGKGGVLPQKLTQHFFSQIIGTEYFII